MITISQRVAQSAQNATPAGTGRRDGIRHAELERTRVREVREAKASEAARDVASETSASHDKRLAGIAAALAAHDVARRTIDEDGIVEDAMARTLVVAQIASDNALRTTAAYLEDAE